MWGNQLTQTGIVLSMVLEFAGLMFGGAVALSFLAILVMMWLGNMAMRPLVFNPKHRAPRYYWPLIGTLILIAIVAASQLGCSVSKDTEVYYEELGFRTEARVHYVAMEANSQIGIIVDDNKLVHVNGARIPKICEEQAVALVKDWTSGNKLVVYRDENYNQIGQPQIGKTDLDIALIERGVATPNHYPAHPEQKRAQAQAQKYKCGMWGQLMPVRSLR